MKWVPTIRTAPGPRQHQHLLKSPDVSRASKFRHPGHGGPKINVRSVILQCFGSGFVFYGSGSGVFFSIRIRIQTGDLNPDPPGS